MATKEQERIRNLLRTEESKPCEENGVVIWLLNGKRHRKFGPAVVYRSGHREWYLYGEKHRADGPAVECINGSVDHWIEGEALSPEDFNNWRDKQNFRI